jgi:hypothetical protein
MRYMLDTKPHLNRYFIRSDGHSCDELTGDPSTSMKTSTIGNSIKVNHLFYLHEINL